MIINPTFKQIHSFFVIVFVLSSLCVKSQTATINFDDLSNGTIIENQYQSKGVVFNIGSSFQGSQFAQAPEIHALSLGTVMFKGKIVEKKNAPRSGGFIADISKCRTSGRECEFYTPVCSGRFITPVRDLALYAGAFDGEGTTQVILKAFNSSHNLIKSVSVSVLAQQGFNNKLSISSWEPIYYFQIEAPNAHTLSIGIDDLSFTPFTSIPDFEFSAAPNALTLWQGKVSKLKLLIHRVNGSSGPISFSVKGLPSGVNGIFSPQSSTETAISPEVVDLTITVDKGTPPTPPFKFSIIGTPKKLIANLPGGRLSDRSKEVGTKKEIYVNSSIVSDYTAKLLGPSQVTAVCKQTRIPIQIIRTPGFTEPINIKIENLYWGINAFFEPSISTNPTDGSLLSMVDLVLSSNWRSVDLITKAKILLSSGGVATMIPIDIKTYNPVVCGSNQLTSSGIAKSRGCTSPLQSMPQWVSVESNNNPQILEGLVLTSEVAGTDWPHNHNGTKDWCFKIEPDNKYLFLCSDANGITQNDNTFDVYNYFLPPHKARTIEVEWENAFLPAEFRPKVGDRAWVMGRWAFDCGHSPCATEIHPPQATAFTRKDLFKFDGFEKAKPVSKVFLYVYGHGAGSRLNKSEYFSIAEKNLGAFAINYSFEVKLPPKPAGSSGIHFKIINKPYGGPDPIVTEIAGENKAQVIYPVASLLNSNKDNRYGTILVIGWR